MTSRRAAGRGMLRTLLAGAAAAALVLTGAVSAAAEDVAATGTITGVVTSETDGTPVAGVVVSVSSTAGGFSFGAVTDESGVYAVSGLASGQYTARFATEGTGSGLLSEYWDGASDHMSAQVITVSDAAVVTGIDASLQAGGSITGTVTRESDGTPVSGVVVTVSSGTGTAGTTMSQHDGSYRVDGLRAGSYTVSFTPSDTGALAREFWDGAYDPGAATAVSVTGGEVTAAIDASLRAPATISGQVTRDADGAAAAGVVEVSTVDGGRIADAEIGADGGYSVSVNPGTYIVHFRAFDERLFAEYWDDAPLREDATAITVAAGESRTGIDAQLAAATAITGVVTAAGSPLASATVTAYDGESLAGLTYTDEAGAYTLALPPGTYTVETRAPLSNPIHATQYYESAAARSESTPVALGADADRTGVDFDLALGGDIRGAISLDGGGEPDGEGATVIAYRWGSDGWEEVARVPSWGAFAFSPDSTIDGGILPAGTYTVGVELPGYCTQFAGGATSLQDAEQFDLSAGETITGVEFALSVECPQPVPTLALDAASVKAGGEISVTGEDFAPGEKVAFELRSDPIALGTLQADAQGDLRGSLRIPASAPAGSHLLVAIGEESNLEVSVAIEVTAAGAGAGSGTGSGAGAPGGAAGAGSGLAATGATVPAGPLLAGLLLAALGTALARRRRAVS